MNAQQDMVHGVRPRMVLAHKDEVYGAWIGRHFRRLGWEVHLASSGEEVRRLASLLQPTAVVLDTELPDESGWLLCKKLLSEQPEMKVVLITTQSTSSSNHFAAFVGAACLVDQAGGVQALVDEVYGTALAAAG